MALWQTELGVAAEPTDGQSHGQVQMGPAAGVVVGEECHPLDSS